MPPSITVIMPTIGRPTLSRTIESILPQMGDEDQIYLVWDRDEVPSNRTPDDPRITHRTFLTPPDTPKPWVGQPQRCFALDHASEMRDLLMWMGDDDLMAGGALDAVRKCAARHPGQVILCKFRGWWPPRPVIWLDEMAPVERFQEGWLSDHSIICWNEPEKLGRFGMHYQGDWTFIKETVENFGGLSRVVWLDKLVAILRPSL
jgi:hypothetical protein